MNDEIKKIMSEERLKEIKDSIDFQLSVCDIPEYETSKLLAEEELELYNEVIRLKKRNKEIYEGFLATQEEMSDYATRIEKAVEYITNTEDMCYYGKCNDGDLLIKVEEDFKNDLLNILRGDDNK